MNTRKINITLASITLVYALLVASMNIFLYKTGSDFAKEHNASHWEIEFTESNGGGFMSSNASGIAWSSYYKFYDENDRNLVLSERLYEPYNEMNLMVYNIVETYGIISVLILAFGIVGVFVTMSKRYNYLGYIFMIVAGMQGSLQKGILNVDSIIISMTCLIASILIFKSRFVDWSGSLLFTFTKEKKKAVSNEA